MAPNLSSGSVVFSSTADPVAAQAPVEQPPVDPRVTARDAIARHLGRPTGCAQSDVNDLTDEEVTGVVAATSDRHTARDEIKRVLSQAYDRRRVAAQREAGEKGEFLRRRGLAQRVLEQALHMSVGDAADVTHRLSAEAIGRLAALDGAENVASLAQALLDGAEKAAVAAAVDEADAVDDPTDVVPGGSTPLVSPEMDSAAEVADYDPAPGKAFHEIHAAEADSEEPPPPRPDKPAKGKGKK